MTTLLDDDNNERPALPHWATLTEVSEALGVPRTAVRYVARLALKAEETWVRKEGGKILLDTTSAYYQEHAELWQQDQQAWEELVGNFAVEDADQLSEHEPEPPCYHWYPSPSLAGYRHWEAFCQWLAAQGLCVFFNLLEGDPATALSWQWGELHSTETYQDIKACVIAALDARMQQHPLPPESLSTPRAAPSPMQGRSWLVKRHGWPFDGRL
jgi:hypothetical protein